MTRLSRTTAVATAALLVFTVAADSRVRHHRHRAAAPVTEEAAPQQPVARPQGVAGYFGPGAYGPFGYGPFGPFSPGYGYGYPRGDLGFALLGALNGGGFRGFVECGNYYASRPGACGF